MLNCPICLETKPSQIFFSHPGEGHKHPFCKPCLMQHVRVSAIADHVLCPCCREPIQLKSTISWKDSAVFTLEEARIYLKAAAILGFGGMVIGALGGATFSLFDETLSLENCVFHGAVYCSLTAVYTIVLARSFRD